MGRGKDIGTQPEADRERLVKVLDAAILSLDSIAANMANLIEELEDLQMVKLSKEFDKDGHS